MIPSYRRTLTILALTALTAYATPLTLTYDAPATQWEKQGLPIGNGSLGGVLMGTVNKGIIQFNVDSLWTGDENPGGRYKSPTPKESQFGAFQNFGELTFNQSYNATAAAAVAPTNYQRSLDIANATHTETWEQAGAVFTRQAIASHPDQIIAWNMTCDKLGSINGQLNLTGTHSDLENVTVVDGQLRLKGTLHNGLKYEARAVVINQGGEIAYTKDAIHLRGCDSAMVLLAADTSYVMSRDAGWMQGDPAEKVAPRATTASQQSWSALLASHVTDYQALFNRVSLDLGKTAPAIEEEPINQRVQRYREQAKELPRPCLDPELEALMFQYGRYLLISSSRPGTLPANLQGIWCNSNKPAWNSDFHSNINLQMNYWQAETANLAELAQPLLDMLTAGIPVYREHTIKQYGDVPI